jgi:hypothetical protein
MFKKIALFAAVAVVLASSQSIFAWGLTYNNGGQSIIGSHSEIKSSGAASFEVFFLTDNTYIQVNNLDKADCKQIADLLRNAYMTGRRIRWANNSGRNSASGYWIPLSGGPNTTVTSYGISTGDNAIIRLVP